MKFLRLVSLVALLALIFSSFCFAESRFKPRPRRPMVFTASSILQYDLRQLAEEVEALKELQFAPTHDLRNRGSIDEPWEVKIVRAEIRVFEAGERFYRDKRKFKGRSVWGPHSIKGYRELTELPKSAQKKRAKLIEAWDDDESSESVREKIAKKLRKSLKKYGSISTGKAGTRFPRIWACMTPLLDE